MLRSVVTNGVRRYQGALSAASESRSELPAGQGKQYGRKGIKHKNRYRTFRAAIFPTGMPGGIVGSYRVMSDNEHYVKLLLVVTALRLATLRPPRPKPPTRHCTQTGLRLRCVCAHRGDVRGKLSPFGSLTAHRKDRALRPEEAKAAAHIRRGPRDARNRPPLPFQGNADRGGGQENDLG